MMIHKSKMALAVLSLLIETQAVADSPSFGGNVVLASSYVFRGIRQFQGVAFQGLLEGRWSRFIAGIWYSNVNLESELGHETDFFIQCVLPTGSLKSVLGVTAYAYDFNKFNAFAKREFEVFGSAAYGALSLGVYFIPAQKSTQVDPVSSNYWIELSGTQSVKAIDWTLGLNHGTYSSRFLAIPQTGAVDAVSISALKQISESVKLSWNASLPLDSVLKNRYWVALTFSY